MDSLNHHFRFPPADEAAGRLLKLTPTQQTANTRKSGPKRKTKMLRSVKIFIRCPPQLCLHQLATSIPHALLKSLTHLASTRFVIWISDFGFSILFPIFKSSRTPHKHWLCTLSVKITRKTKTTYHTDKHWLKTRFQPQFSATYRSVGIFKVIFSPLF